MEQGHIAIYAKAAAEYEKLITAFKAAQLDVETEKQHLAFAKEEAARGFETSS